MVAFCIVLFWRIEDTPANWFDQFLYQSINTIDACTSPGDPHETLNENNDTLKYSVRHSSSPRSNRVDGSLIHPGLNSSAVAHIPRPSVMITILMHMYPPLDYLSQIWSQRLQSQLHHVTQFWWSSHTHCSCACRFITSTVQHERFSYLPLFKISASQTGELYPAEW